MNSLEAKKQTVANAKQALEATLQAKKQSDETLARAMEAQTQATKAATKAVADANETLASAMEAQTQAAKAVADANEEVAKAQAAHASSIERAAADAVNLRTENERLLDGWNADKERLRSAIAKGQADNEEISDLQDELEAYEERDREIAAQMPSLVPATKSLGGIETSLMQLQLDEPYTVDCSLEATCLWEDHKYMRGLKPYIVDDDLYEDCNDVFDIASLYSKPVSVKDYEEIFTGAFKGQLPNWPSDSSNLFQIITSHCANLAQTNPNVVDPSWTTGSSLKRSIVSTQWIASINILGNVWKNIKPKRARRFHSEVAAI